MDTKERAASDFPLHIGQMIRREMLRQQRSVSWLAEQIPCDRRNIYHIFRRPNIDSGLLLKLSLILHTDFFRSYSAYLADTQVVTTPPAFHTLLRRLAARRAPMRLLISAARMCAYATQSDCNILGKYPSHSREG